MLKHDDDPEPYFTSNDKDGHCEFLLLRVYNQKELRLHAETGERGTG